MAAILLLAVFIRIPVILRNPIPAGDGIASNVEVAVNILEGNGFSTMRKWTLYDDSMDGLRPEGNRQPILSLLLALLFTVTGPSFTAAQLFSLLTGLFCLFMCWLWARRVFGKLPALFTLLVLSITPLFVWYSTQPDSLLLFTGLFFAVLILADRREIDLRTVLILGVICALSYLVRTQGLILVFSMGVWIVLRGGGKRIGKLFAFGGVFLVICAPWFIRNVRSFESPTYTQGSQFLLNENHWSAWEVRDSEPEPLDMLRNRGPAAVAVYTAKGIFRVLEPITTGSLHRSTVFGQPSLAAFALLGLLALRRKSIRRKMLLPLIAAAPALLALVLHEHSSRYLAFFSVIIVGLGASGLGAFVKLTSGKTAVVAPLLLLMIFLPSVAGTLSESSLERADEAEETALWLKQNSEPDDWVVTFPLVELLIWKYRRPTLTMPNDYEMLLWPCLEEHGVRFVVVDRYLPVMRPRLSRRWRWDPVDRIWSIEEPPEFLSEVYRSSSGATVVYEMTGSVPDGFMKVDSLPRDNMRALPPGGRAW